MRDGPRTPARMNLSDLGWAKRLGFGKELAIHSASIASSCSKAAWDATRNEVRVCIPTATAGTTINLPKSMGSSCAPTQAKQELELGGIVIGIAVQEVRTSNLIK